MPKISSSYSHHFGLLSLWFLSAYRAGKMKSKASRFLKQVLSRLASIVKAKSAAVRSKTSAVKTHLIIFSLLHNKKVLMSAISNKIHKLVALDKEDVAATADDSGKMIVQYNAAASEAQQETTTNTVESSGREIIEEEEEEEDEDYYPDLRHSLFDDEDSVLGDDGTGSVIDQVKNSWGQEQGEFILENEIDHVAELFIKRFHRQLRIQRLDSFKRHQEEIYGGEN